ncbi:USP6 N-terminal-like protein isoform X1 [Oryctolagus cuniculus]|uniref:USP6 N-terminal-like protein isoform X1 n=2 Tax=Oryctolagus cuniculus TaxID=9986 RepID=UPI00387A08A2
MGSSSCVFCCPAGNALPQHTTCVHSASLDMEAVKSQLPQKQDVIISKYEQGCQGRAQVARPEEEDINTRPFINYLGILQEKMLPQDRALEAKHRHQEAQRVEKWVKMMKHWTQYQSSKKMESQVYKGIPLPMRGKVWSFLLDVDKVKAENPGKYQQMKGQGKLLSEHIHQIDADVRRTFRNHVMFRQRYGMKQQALFHVLLAHSEFDVEVGYRQGMNWVAAVLLMFLDEEDAFWALTQLMRKPRHAMHGFYKANCAKLVRLQQHHENILKCRLPKLKKHLEDQGVSTAAYTRKWFQQCFVDGVPFSLMLRFFDVYILEGEPMLTAMSYTALKIHRKQALQLSGDNLLEYLQEGLRQAWALRDNSVLRRLKASKTELERCKGLLPPPAKQEEMPRRLLGLELMSLVPRPHPTSQRLRVGCRKDRVGRPVAADWRELPSGLAPRTQGAGHPESNPGFFLGASDLGDTGDLSQGPCLFTTMSLLYTGECGLPGGKPLQGLLGSPKPAQPSLRCSRDSRSRGHPAAQHLPKLDPTVLTPLEPTMEDEECSVEGASP